MNPVTAFKASSPNPSRDDLQEFAFTLGRIRTGDGYGTMLLTRRSRSLKAAFPAFDFYPMSEHPDATVTSICVDDPEDWIAIAEIDAADSITTLRDGLAGKAGEQ